MAKRKEGFNIDFSAKDFVLNNLEQLTNVKQANFYSSIIMNKIREDKKEGWEQELNKEAVLMAKRNVFLLPKLIDRLPNSDLLTQEDRDDLFQMGFISLVNDVKKFDPWHELNLKRAGDMDETRSLSSFVYASTGKKLIYQMKVLAYGDSLSIGGIQGNLDVLRRARRVLIEYMKSDPEKRDVYLMASLIIDIEKQKAGMPTWEDFEEFRDKFENEKTGRRLIHSRIEMPKRGKETVRNRLLRFSEIENLSRKDRLERGRYRKVKDDETGEYTMMEVDLESTIGTEFNIIENEVAIRERNQKVADLMNEILSNRERRVIELRYFQGNTLKETGILVGLTPERIRQIERAALRKLRYPWVKKQLRDYK